MVTKKHAPLKNKNLTERLEGNYLLIISLIIFVIFSAISPEKIPCYPHYIDWQTIITLTALAFVTTGLKKSGFFHNLSLMLVTKFKQERLLSLFMVLISAIMAMFLTNDIALFIIVPLTLSLKDVSKNLECIKLIVFEAIAVNVGSTLTPIGNPQNIFLWHQWAISFGKFIYFMLPVEIIMVIILVAFVLTVFPSRVVDMETLPSKIVVKRKLLITSVSLLIGYLISTEFNLSFYALIGIFGIYCIIFTDVLKEIDWPLIILFVIMFIDLHLITDLSQVKTFFNSLDLKSWSNLFITGVITSQFISNVPAVLLLSKFSHNWEVISYGVNVGGNGIVIGSLANIIALRLANKKGSIKTFHKYSIPFLIISVAIVWAYLAYIKGGGV